MQADERLRIYIDKDEQEVIRQLVEILDNAVEYIYDADYAKVIRAIADGKPEVKKVESVVICYGV